MFARWMTASAVAVLLGACGGGGGGSGEPGAGSGESGAGSDGSGAVTCTGLGTSTVTCEEGRPPENTTPGTGPSEPPSSGAGSTPPSSGGGSTPPSSGDTTPPPGSTTPPPASQPAPDAPPSSGGTPPPPPAELTAEVADAPPHRARLTGEFQLLIVGSGIRNAELLPPSGYAPKLARLAPNSAGTSAAGSFDARLLSPQIYSLRISAFDKPPGTGGAKEVVAMEPREWFIEHNLDWRKGDRFTVNFPSIYPLFYDTTYARNWLAQSNEHHQEQLQYPKVWTEFVMVTEQYVPHHIDFNGAEAGLQSERRNCLDNQNIPSCRAYLTALVRWIES